MKIQEYIQRDKILYQHLLTYLEDIDEEQTNENFRFLVKDIDTIIQQMKSDELYKFLQLISIISDNHHRGPFFFSRIEKIFAHYKNDIINSLSNNDLFDIFKENKRILLSLFQNQIIIPDKSICDYFNSKSDENSTEIFNDYEAYFYP